MLLLFRMFVEIDHFERYMNGDIFMDTYAQLRCAETGSQIIDAVQVIVVDLQCGARCTQWFFFRYFLPLIFTSYFIIFLSVRFLQILQQF